MSNKAPRNQASKPREIGVPAFASIRSAESLQQLRTHVKQAAKELRRLKKENAALAEHIRELEALPRIDPGTAILTFDEDREKLRTSVKAFIQAIDTYLAEDSG